MFVVWTTIMQEEICSKSSFKVMGASGGGGGAEDEAKAI